jgi:hypothetical protein
MSSHNKGSSLACGELWRLPGRNEVKDLKMTMTWLGQEDKEEFFGEREQTVQRWRDSIEL